MRDRDNMGCGCAYPTLTRMEWYAGLAMHAFLGNNRYMKRAEELIEDKNSGYADELEVVAIDAVLAAKRLIEQIDKHKDIV